jgi:hypothetical protein
LPFPSSEDAPLTEEKSSGRPPSEPAELAAAVQLIARSWWLGFPGVGNTSIDIFPE